MYIDTSNQISLDILKLCSHIYDLQEFLFMTQCISVNITGN